MSVDKEVVEEPIDVSVDKVPSAITLTDEPSLQRSRPTFADGVHHLGFKREPVVLVRVLRLDRAQSRSGEALGRGLVRRNGTPGDELRARRAGGTGHRFERTQRVVGCGRGIVGGEGHA